MSLTIEQHLDAEAPIYITDPDKQTFIEISQSEISRVCYGTNYNRAVALYAAHLLTMRDRNKANKSGIVGVGPVTSKREGGQAITFGATTSGTNNDAYLGQTTYGLALINLRTKKIIGASVASLKKISCDKR
jgi:hypothetical protein